MTEKNDTSASSFTDGNKSIFQESAANSSSFEDNDISRLYQFESLTYGAHHSPGEGMVGPRSVKEVEETHANLKKENFNLKLRIYFLEERMNSDFNINPDNAVMKNIELKVQLECLRKELSEKQEMLCQAVKTMELDEEDYKKLLAGRDKKMFDLEKDHQNLQRKYEVMQQQDNERSHGDIMLPDPDNLYQSFDLEANISELENKLGAEHLENVRLKSAFDEEIRARDLRISCLQAEVDEKSAIMTDQHKSIVVLESDMEKRFLEIKRLKDDRNEDNKRIADLDASLREAQQTIETVETEYEHESMKVNRMKLSLSQRNKRIMEMEDIVRRQKTHIGTLEAQVRQEFSQVNDRTQSVQTTSVAASTVAVSPKCAAAFPALNGEPPSTFPAPNQPNLTKSITDDNTEQNTSNESNSSPINHHPDSPPQASSTNQNSLDTTQTLQKNLEDSRHHILKLEKDRRRAGEIIHSMLEKRKELSQEISKLKTAHKEKDQQIDLLKMTIQEMKEEDRNSRHGACANTTTPPKPSTPSSSEIVNEPINQTLNESTDINALCCKYQTLVNDLDTQKEILLAIIKEKDGQMQKLELDYNIAVTDKNIKDERIIDLEQLVQDYKTNQNSREKLDIGSEKQSASFWVLEGEEKDREIERLETELKRKTTDIQTLVNKELWEKNREIERAQQLVRNKDSQLDKLIKEMALLKEELLKFTTPNIVSVNDEDKGEDIQRKLRNSIEDRKRLLDQIEIMYADNEHPVDSHKDYLHLKNEYKQLKDEFERSERLREQTNDICSVLSNRLEELAFFLDSLLKQKTLLGFLGNKKNCKLRQIIDQSLDLSRTLNMNLSQMNADQSLLQLTNLSNFFNTATQSCNNSEVEVELEDEAAATEIHESQIVINEQARIINLLGQQIETMKAELQHLNDPSPDKRNLLSNYDESVVNILLDISKMGPESTTFKSPQMILENLMSDKLNIQQNEQLLNTTSTTLKYWQESNSTESESWSEPDRDVSKQRIGLNNTKLIADASTEDDAHTQQLIKSKRSALMLENKQLQDENRHLKEKNELLLQTEQSFCVVSEQLKKELLILDSLRLENESLRRRISDKEAALNNYETARLRNQKQLTELHNIIEDLRNQQSDLERNCEVNTKELTNQMNQLEQEKLHATNKTLQTEEELQKLKLVVQNYEASLKELYKEKMYLESALRQESELIQKHTEEFKDRIKYLQIQSENEVKRITETALTMKQKYESEYVKRAELDKMMSSIKELESLQMVLNTTEEKIQLLEDNETRLKNTLQDTHQEYREKLIELRKELDLSTLKYSEIMLEKTRQMKERAALEVQIKEYANKEDDFKRQVADFQQSLNSMKGMFQTQVANLNSQKSALQLKLGEVESVNEELRNSLIKHSHQGAKTSTSAPTTPSKFFSLFLGRQFSYSTDSEHNRPSCQAIANQSGDQLLKDQQENVVEYDLMNNRGNTSPDLGIESDQGRFSSLENNNGNTASARPFHNTLELSQQMHGLLLHDDDDNDDNGGRKKKMASRNGNNDNKACNNGRCVNVVAENVDLREKLIKTRSALEETVSQLKYANEKKKHVEKTICKQIHKTSQVLRKAKANLDSGSETDLRK